MYVRVCMHIRYLILCVIVSSTRRRGKKTYVWAGASIDCVGLVCLHGKIINKM